MKIETNFKVQIQKYPYLHVPHGWSLGITRGIGVSVAEIFNAMYKAKLEILGRWKGPNQKAIPGGQNGYF